MKKRVLIALIVLIICLIPAVRLNLRQGVLLSGVKYVEKERDADSWQYDASQGGAEMSWSGDEGIGWIEHQSVRHDMKLRWNGDAALIEFEDGETVEGRWLGGELVDETGMPLWFGEVAIVVGTSDGGFANEISRRAIARTLCEMDRRENEPFGSLAMVMIGVFGYLLGLLGTLYPEELSMFGHRWKYDYVELSDMGRTSAVVGGYVAMAAGIVFMYLPCFV